jgi:hypothetical protein
MIPVALFTPDVETKLTFSPILLIIYFYHVFLFSNSFTDGLQEHKRLYRDATPEELLAGVKVAAEKGQGFRKDQLWGTKSLFVDKIQIQDQRWNRLQRNPKLVGTGLIFVAILMLGGGYISLLVDGLGEKALKVTMGRISLKDAHMSVFELVGTLFGAVVFLIYLVPYLRLANRAG